jgi:heme/copper-type cytochrome/quinol oxidase subunit 3
MTSPDTYALSALPVGKAAERHPPGQWGMLLLISTEAALFACLLFSYFYLGARSTTPWPPFGPPDLHVAALNTLILLSSSVTLHWGERGIRRGQVGRLRVGLALTILLGLTFLSLQGYEYSRQPFTPMTDAYGSTFFTVTGMHGTHVFVGLVVLTVVSVMAARGKFAADRHWYVSNAALYWHFVDAVWIAVFSSLYLSPHLGL